MLNRTMQSVNSTIHLGCDAVWSREYVADVSKQHTENCALKGYCAACSGNFVPTFPDILSGPILTPIGPINLSQKMGPIGVKMGPDRLSRNDGYEMTAIRCVVTHLLRGGSLKSCSVLSLNSMLRTADIYQTTRRHIRLSHIVMCMKYLQPLTVAAY